jgi:hypothetical protein
MLAKMTVSFVKISTNTAQEELYDVGKLLSIVDKTKSSSRVDKVYHKWFLALARPFYNNPTIALKAMLGDWTPRKIAKELGVEIEGLPDI